MLLLKKRFTVLLAIFFLFATVLLPLGGKPAMASGSVSFSVKYTYFPFDGTDSGGTPFAYYVTLTGASANADYYYRPYFYYSNQYSGYVWDGMNGNWVKTSSNTSTTNLPKITTDSNGNWSGWIFCKTDENQSYGGTVKLRVRFYLSSNTSTKITGTVSPVHFMDMDGTHSGGQNVDTQGGWIEGHAYNTNGNPVSDYIVVVKDSSGNVVGAYSTEDNGIEDGYSTNAGYYKVSVPEGTGYSVELWDPSNNTIVGSATTGVDVTAHQTTSNVDINANSSSSLSVSTNPASNIGSDSATLNGTLTDLGSNDTSVTVYFQYGTDITYGSETPHQTMNATGSFSADISGLSPDTTYHFRAVAVGDQSGTTVYGSDVTFKTNVQVVSPTVETQDATNIAKTTAILNGNLTDTGNASNVTVYFRYGTDTNYGSETPHQTMSSAGTFTANLTNLSPDTTYHFRAVAVNDAGTSYGDDKTFVTLSVNAPVVLFDNTKDETAGNADWTIDGAYSDWANALRNDGYIVESLDSGPITESALSGITVFVIPEPQDEFTSDEITAIKNFVNNGGGLVLIADHSGSDRNNNGHDSPHIYDNNFGVSDFGFEFNLDNFSQHPINSVDHNVYPGLTQGVNSIGEWGASTISITDSNKAKAVIYSNDNSKIIVVGAEVGSGRVAVIGDSSPFDDGTADSQNSGDHLYDGWNEYDDSTLGIDMVEWCAAPRTTPPSVTSTVPQNNATNVDVNTNISATFSKDMDSSTITTSTFTVKDASNNPVSGTVSYNSTTKTATFTPSSPLAYDTSYTATISGTVKDTDGNAMGSDYSWSFATETQVSVIPISDARTKPDGTEVTIEGVTTVPLGTFSSKYFYVQDSTGGIEIYRSSGFGSLSIPLSEKLKIKGKISTYNGVKELVVSDLSDIQDEGSVSKVQPASVNIPDLPNYYGELVSVSGTVSDKTNNSFYVSDANGNKVKVYIKSRTNISLSDINNGDMTEVVGIDDVYHNAPKIMPRFQSDITKIVITPPSPPQSLTATADNTNKSITLNWTASTLGTYPIAGYAIYRGTSSGNEDTTPIATVDATSTTYTDTNLSPNTYYYIVKAFDNQSPPNYSSPSNEASATINAPVTITPIGDARTKPNGTEVTIQGSVTVPTGVFDSSKREFYVQDSTGGIDVYYSHGGLPNLQLGDIVKITGTIDMYNGKKEIKPLSVSDVVFVSSGTPVQPLSIEIAGVEDHLGQLVKVSGTISGLHSGYFYLNGSGSSVKIYIKSDTGISLSNISNGDLVEVTGIADVYRTTKEIMPRFQSDITKIVITPPSPPSSLTATSNPATQSITLKWTASTPGTYPIAGYAIYRGTSSGNEGSTPIATMGPSTLSYTDTSVSIGVQYYYYVKAFDNQFPPDYSNPSKEVRVFLPKPSDTVPPTASLPNISSLTNRDNLNFSITATDNSGRIAEVVVKDNGTLMKKMNYLPENLAIPLFEGINDIQIIVYDPSGNYTSKTFRIVSDTKPPIISINIPNNTISTDTLALNGKIFDQTTGVSQVTINGKPVTISPDGSLNTEINLTAGTNKITIKATDKAGNTITKTFTITYVPPKTNTSETISLQINNPYITINGTKKKIDKQNSKSIIKNNRTLLPIRSLIESLGGTIKWNPKTREVTIELNGNTIVLTIGKNTALVNGIKTKIDPNNPNVTPIIINGRTYLPLRFIAEHLNCTITWDPVTKTITVYYYG